MKPPLALRIVEVSDPQTLLRIAQLRVEAWGDRMNPAFVKDGGWTDTHDANALHLAGVAEDGSIVGATRLTLHASLEDVPDWEDIRVLNLDAVSFIAWASRLVIEPSARGPGVAEQFDRALLDAARRLGASALYAGVSPAHTRTLTKLGFEHLGRSPVSARERYERWGVRVDVHFMRYRFSEGRSATSKDE